MPNYNIYIRDAKVISEFARYSGYGIYLSSSEDSILSRITEMKKDILDKKYLTAQEDIDTSLRLIPSIKYSDYKLLEIISSDIEILQDDFYSFEGVQYKVTRRTFKSEDNKAVTELYLDGYHLLDRNSEELSKLNAIKTEFRETVSDYNNLRNSNTKRKKFLGIF